MRSRTSGLVVALVALITIAGWAAIHLRTDSDTPELRLEEVSARTLPPGFDVRGASVADNGDVLLWAGNQSYLVLLHGDSAQQIASASVLRPVAARFIAGDSAIEVVDAIRKQLVRLTPAGTFVGEEPIGIAWAVESAVHSGSAWLLGGRDVAGNYRVVRLDASRPPTRLLTVPARMHRGSRLTMELTSANGELFATMLSHPHTVARVAETQTSPANGAWAGSFKTPDLPKRPLGLDPLWVSLGLHPLDNGFIRTFSDLRSDSRVLATYDANGRSRRTSVLQVPMAVVETVPRERMLLALRRTDRLELVTYKWRWVGAPP